MLIIMLFITYSIIVILVLDLKSRHCFGEELDGEENVTEDKRDKLFPIFVCVALPMDDTHLFYEGTLASFSSTFRY